MAEIASVAVVAAAKYMSKYHNIADYDESMALWSLSRDCGFAAEPVRLNKWPAIRHI